MNFLHHILWNIHIHVHSNSIDSCRFKNHLHLLGFTFSICRLMNKLKSFENKVGHNDEELWEMFDSCLQVHTSSLQLHSFWTWGLLHSSVLSRAANNPSVFTITYYRTRALSWLKAPTSAFTFKTLLRHYTEQAPKQGK